jgi:LPXTG-motif cell wall-anchored protein
MLMIAAICVIGIVAVAYGMANDNNLIFILGLVFVIAGYLLLRRRIKESIRNNREVKPGK